MTKRVPVIAGFALIAALAVFLYFYFASKNAEVVEFKLADSVVTLDVPAGSLPAGFKTDALKVTEVGKDEAPLKADDGSKIYAYKLEPEGLVFKKPVTVSLALVGANNTAPLVFSVSPEYGVELLDKTSVVVDQKEKKTVVSADVKHFSQIVVSRDGIFEIERPDTIRQAVGQTFSVPVQIRKADNIPVLRSSAGTTYETTFETTLKSWALAGTYDTSQVLTPTHVADKPADMPIEGYAYTATADFTCERVGGSIIYYYADLVYVLDTVVRNSLGEIDSGETRHDLTGRNAFTAVIGVQCVANLPRPTAVDISQPSHPDCPQDSDGGNNPGTRGVCLEANGARMQDECFDESALNEWSCDVNNPGFCTSQIVNCPGRCENGACLPL